MEQNKLKHFKCKNYYSMSLEEIEEYLAKMRNWLLRYSPHPKQQQVSFALSVAYKAKLLKESGVDKFTQLVLDILC